MENIIYWGEIGMLIKNDKIELTPEEKEIFIGQFKLSILYQLHSEKLLTYEQIDQIIKNHQLMRR
ncbi:hypothetical protein EHE19_012695 [Ruminiclostridium herbifermentans]|uniref:Uncharacterized protein n=1 Tax=Ruminiclostridium herbifermentans TaxID=2488810 RepID=A0A4U7JI00_9FIRM|nr:hypothetical protein [Ruminiclostridium herbifermentans]QNU68956.1 hypothetical protein EHE19_012695 [Ruminiclostridium herbifermentans]